MNALIIDDRPEQLSALNFMLYRFCQKVKRIFSARTIEDGIAFLLEDKIDIIFLDIDRAEIAKLKSYNLKGKSCLNILLISSSKTMNPCMLEAYGIHSIQKPYGINTLLRSLSSISLSTLGGKLDLDNQIDLIHRLMIEDTVVISSNSEFLVFERSEILRFEQIKGRVFCILTNGYKIETTSKLDELIIVLQMRGFLRFRNNYLLNKKYYYKDGNLSVNDLGINNEKSLLWLA